MRRCTLCDLTDRLPEYVWSLFHRELAAKQERKEGRNEKCYGFLPNMNIILLSFAEPIVFFSLAPMHVCTFTLAWFFLGYCYFLTSKPRKSQVASQRLSVSRMAKNKGLVSPIIPSAPNCSSRHFIFHRKCVSFE